MATDREIEAGQRAYEACREYRKQADTYWGGRKFIGNRACEAVYDAAAPIEPEPLTEEELKALDHGPYKATSNPLGCITLGRKAAAWIRWRMAEDRR